MWELPWCTLETVSLFLLIWGWKYRSKNCKKAIFAGFIARDCSFLYMWPRRGWSGYPKLNFISNKYPIGRAWLLRYLPWKLAILDIFQSSKCQKNEEWWVIKKYTILDHSWALTFGTATIFHNNNIPGHNRAKLKMSHFFMISSTKRVFVLSASAGTR